MRKLYIALPMALGLSGCVSVPQHLNALEGELGASGRAILKDVTGKQCELQVTGSLVSPMICSDGTMAKAYLTFTSDGNYVGYGQYPDGSQVALRVTTPHLERPTINAQKPALGGYRASQIYNPPSTYRRKRSPSRSYYWGPRGGCYYINSSGNKSYVDHSFCS